jgi:excisionase family DNA binding protein
MMSRAARLTARTLISLPEAAEYAGCSVRTVRRMIATGTITGYRVGGRRLIRVDMDELELALRPIAAATR